MKLNVNCEHYKPLYEGGKTRPCKCHYLNRNFHRELKLYKMFMKQYENKGEK